MLATGAASVIRSGTCCWWLCSGSSAAAGAPAILKPLPSGNGLHSTRHSGINFVTPHQRHNDEAVDICRHRAVVYTPKESTTVIAIHTLLASTAGGLDQSTTFKDRIRSSYVGDGCLNSGRSGIFPGRECGGKPHATPHAGIGDQAQVAAQAEVGSGRSAFEYKKRVNPATSTHAGCHRKDAWD